MVPFLLGATLTPQPPQALVDAWRDHIAPHEDESRWQQIDWHADLGTGVRTAAEQQKPVLLWLMNGHPLGCT
ncbi:MAG: hypothetical protein NXI31_07540 [bacterium]|nr:hypothetical protein [bacterium]